MCNPLLQVVQDSVQELLQLVPQIKSNISAAIAMVPEVVVLFTLLSHPHLHPSPCRCRAS